MAEYKVYGDSISGNCLKVKWTLDYLGVDYQWVETSVLKAETRSAEFLALNPAGQVPLLLTPKGKALAQSNAIILFLAEKYDRGLVPEKAFQRAKVYEWLFWEQYSHEPYIAVRRFHKAFLGKADAEIDPRLLERGEAALRRLDLQLGETPYLVGEALTLADIALVAYTRVAHEGGFDLAKFPFVKDWIARIERDLSIEESEAA